MPHILSVAALALCIPRTPLLLPVCKFVPRRSVIARDAGGVMPASSETWDEYHTKWEGFWSKGLPQGAMFDASRSSPALVSLLDSGAVEVAGTRVLVPGCGRGYDLVEFSRRGAAEAVGLEISKTAVQDATAYIDAVGLSPEQRAVARVVECDFFQDQPQLGAFDLGYDYTFFCAIRPDMREEWGRRWAGLLRKGGLLVTLCFPVDPTKEGGPPFRVHPDDYQRVLHGAGFETVSIDPVPESLSHPGRGGKEYMAVFRRQ